MNGLFSINSPLWNLMNKAIHFLWLSILWFVCSIPVVTVGASTTALYHVMLKYARDEEGYITSSFFHGFRQNVKQATIIWGILLVISIILGIDFILYYRSGQTGALSLLFMTLFFSLLLALLLMNIYVYAVLAKFRNSTGHIIKNSLIMALSHWPSGIAMLMLSLLILALGFLAFPPILFLAPAGICYVNSKFLVRIFDKYIPIDEQAVPEYQTN